MFWDFLLRIRSHTGLKHQQGFGSSGYFGGKGCPSAVPYLSLWLGVSVCVTGVGFESFAQVLVHGSVVAVSSAFAVSQGQSAVKSISLVQTVEFSDMDMYECYGMRLAVMGLGPKAKNSCPNSLLSFRRNKP